MSNLLERAISSDDGDRAAKIIQEALGIEFGRRRQLRLSQDLAGRPPAARSHYRRVAADRSTLLGLAVPPTPPRATEGRSASSVARPDVHAPHPARRQNVRSRAYTRGGCQNFYAALST
jgi:hypothetical protein